MYAVVCIKFKRSVFPNIQHFQRSNSSKIQNSRKLNLQDLKFERFKAPQFPGVPEVLRISTRLKTLKTFYSFLKDKEFEEDPNVQKSELLKIVTLNK